MVAETRTPRGPRSSLNRPLHNSLLSPGRAAPSVAHQSANLCSCLVEMEARAQGCLHQLRTACISCTRLYFVSLSLIHTLCLACIHSCVSRVARVYLTQSVSSLYPACILHLHRACQGKTASRRRWNVSPLPQFNRMAGRSSCSCTKLSMQRPAHPLPARGLLGFRTGCRRIWQKKARPQPDHKTAVPT